MFIKTGIIGTINAILGTELTSAKLLFSAPIILRFSSALEGSIFYDS
ncbi:hypothetical protein NBRC111893_360 [Lentilactobacillus kosonis]|uniref:Uncharacterized protein n=1 Tax=Lentilactobacillus kosonis TaxID=2810561 RepID=A0A401FIL9_9LACO|nr:hypothetical protein NBRC111893_360 [Lentilactobacillus kosonis]